MPPLAANEHIRAAAAHQDVRRIGVLRHDSGQVCCAKSHPPDHCRRPPGKRYDVVNGEAATGTGSATEAIADTETITTAEAATAAYPIAPARSRTTVPTAQTGTTLAIAWHRTAIAAARTRTTAEATIPAKAAAATLTTPTALAVTPAEGTAAEGAAT